MLKEAQVSGRDAECMVLSTRRAPFVRTMGLANQHSSPRRRSLTSRMSTRLFQKAHVLHIGVKTSMRPGTPMERQGGVRSRGSCLLTFAACGTL